MTWLRKGTVHLLSLVLLLALVGGALATGFNLAFSQPDRVKNWLRESKIYDHFVGYAVTEAQKTAGDNEPTGAVSLNDVAVQQAAQSAFPPRLVQDSVNTFLDSNYAWLQGKTDTPAFTIDLTAAKQSFAEQVGQYVRTYSAGLPACTAAQLTALSAQPVNPLSATCRPAATTPEALGAEATRQIATGDFLRDSVITPDNLTPEDDQTNPETNQPYYQQLAHAPQAYQFAQKLPLLLGILALLSAIGIIFIAPRKRLGLRRLGIILTIAGLTLLAIKSAADFGFQKLEATVFDKTSTGQLEQSLTDFAHRAEAALTQTHLLFGLACLLLALISFAILFMTRHPKPATPSKPKPPAGPASPPELPPTGRAAPAPAAQTKPPKPPKRPRLIQ